MCEICRQYRCPSACPKFEGSRRRKKSEKTWEDIWDFGRTEPRARGNVKQSGSEKSKQISVE